MWGGNTARVPRGLAAGTGAWTTDWPTKTPLAAQPKGRGCGFQSLYRVEVLPSSGTQPCPRSKNQPPQGYPARNPPPRDAGAAKREDQTHRVHQSAMVQGLMPGGGPENGEGSNEVTPIINPQNRGVRSNDRTSHQQPPTWKDHQRGVFWVSLMLPPCSNRTPRVSRVFTYPRTRGGI